MFGLFNPSLGSGLVPGASGMGMQMPQQQNPAMGLGMGLMAPQTALNPQFQQSQFNPQMLHAAMGLMQMGQPQQAPMGQLPPAMPQGGHPMQLANLNPAQLLSYMRFANA